MSVWPKTPPLAPSLSTAEGALVSVSIHVEPHCLESLLEALAQVEFSDQSADLSRCRPDLPLRRRPRGDRIHHPGGVPGLRRPPRRSPQRARGLRLPADCMRAVSMLDDIQSESQKEPAPEGAAYVSRCRVKRRAALA